MGERSTIEQGASGGGVELRLFAALRVSDGPARVLADEADLLARHGGGVRACDPADLHVTFAFLGSVAEEYVPSVAAALDATARSIPGPTACRVREVRPFGSGRVLGVDVDVELHAMLDSARDRFVDAVRPYAPHADRRAWRPHLSLLRVGRRAEAPAVDVEQRLRLASTGWVSSELLLYASLPAPTGSTYRVLHAATLGAPVAGSSDSCAVPPG